MESYALVVQPDVRLLETCARAATYEGLETVSTRDGQEAGSLIRRHGAPALLITGLSLPRIDGFSLLTELRRIASAHASPALAVSAFPAFREAAWRMREELGLADVLPSRLPREAIQRAVRRALAGERSERPRPEPVTGRGPAAILPEAAVVAQEMGQEGAFAQVVADAAAEFGVSVALVSLSLEETMWVAAHHGFDAWLERDPSLARGWAFCRAVVEAGEALVIPDAVGHPVFGQEPLVVEGRIRGYAGVPLLSSSGRILGTLAVADAGPIRHGPEKLDALAVLARRVAGELEFRLSSLRLSGDTTALAAALGASTEASTLALLHAALSGAATGVLLIDSQRRVVFANPAAGELLASDRLIDMTREELVRHVLTLADDPEDFLRKVRIPPGGPYAAREEFELGRPRRRALRWSTRPVQLPAGLGQLTMLEDVTAQADLEAARERFETVDPLTSLVNRRGGVEIVGREIARARRTRSSLAFAMFDVDALKLVNESRGHAAGDALLREVARAVAASAGPQDTVIRWSGEEILAVLPRSGAIEARHFARIARNAMHAEGETISSGVVEWSEGETPEEVVARLEREIDVVKRGEREAAS